MNRAILGLLLCLAAVELGCGGGGGSSAGNSGGVTPPSQNDPVGQFSPSSLNGTVGVQFDEQISLVSSPATSVVIPYVWKITSGSLPPGIQAPGGGTNPPNFPLKGVPTAAGSYSFTLEVRDSSATPKLMARANISFTVDSAFKFAKQGLPEAVVGVPYSAFVIAVNGVPPVQYTVANGQLPSGLQLNATTGEISGTPTSTNGTPMTITATDSSSPSRTIQQSAFVHVNPALRFADVTFKAYRGSNVGIFINAFGGVSPYKATLVSGTIPPGMQLSGLQIKGTPTTNGDYVAVLKVSDSYSPPNEVQGTITISVTEPPPMVVTQELPHAVQGIPYSYRLAAIKGLRPYTWKNISTLPAGLTLSSDGLISGTPSAGASTASFYVSVTDSTTPPQSSSLQWLTLVVRPASTGRNDSMASATPIQNGSWQASLSPYAKASGVAAPDQDFYKVSATGGAVVTVTVNKWSSWAGGIDPALEILDDAGTRLTTCRNPGSTDGLSPDTVDPTPNAFDDPCVNDDIDPGVNTDAKLELQVPGTGIRTIYLRVFDVNGRARPDMKYTLLLSGAN